MLIEINDPLKTTFRKLTVLLLANPCMTLDETPTKCVECCIPSKGFHGDRDVNPMR